MRATLQFSKLRTYIFGTRGAFYQHAVALSPSGDGGRKVVLLLFFDSRQPFRSYEIQVLETGTGSKTTRSYQRVFVGWWIPDLRPNAVAKVLAASRYEERGIWGCGVSIEQIFKPIGFGCERGNRSSEQD